MSLSDDGFCGYEGAFLKGFYLTVKQWDHTRTNRNGHMVPLRMLQLNSGTWKLLGVKLETGMVKPLWCQQCGHKWHLGIRSYKPLIKKQELCDEMCFPQLQIYGERCKKLKCLKEPKLVFRNKQKKLSVEQ